MNGWNMDTQGSSITIKVLNEQKDCSSRMGRREGGAQVRVTRVAIRNRVNGSSNVKERGCASIIGLDEEGGEPDYCWTPDLHHSVNWFKPGSFGKVEKYDIILEKLTPDDLKGILSGDKGVCFECRIQSFFSGSENRIGSDDGGNHQESCENVNRRILVVAALRC